MTIATDGRNTEPAPDLIRGGGFERLELLERLELSSVRIEVIAVWRDSGR
jgi:hypothetical protein